MALQIWLPLNGNLNNYGLSDLKFSVYQSSTTSNGSGKIGSCYTNNSNSSGGVISDKKINLGTKHSMFCWVKMTDFYSASSLTGILGQHRYPTCQGMGITMKYSSSTTGYLSVNTGNGNGSRTYNTYCGSSTLSAGTWYHVGYTYNSGVIKLYVNGKLDGTHSYTSSIIEDYVQLFSWSFNSSSITNEIHGNYKLNGFLNDVRIYDHCLSDKEVSEISKGLIVHYPLDDCSSKRLRYDKNIYKEPDGTLWVRVIHHNNPASALFSSSDSFASGVYKDADRWFDLYMIKRGLGSYEFMVKQKTTSSATETKYRWIQTKDPFTATYNDVKPASVTRITTSGYTDGGFGGLYILNSNTHMVIANTSNGNWYGAFGCWTPYNGGIPGYPNTTITNGYMDLYVKVNAIEYPYIYDCSGYMRDGTAYGVITVSDNTARYDGSVVLDGGNTAIKIGNLSTLIHDGIFTFNCWFNKQDFSSKGWETIFGGPSGFEFQSKRSTTNSPSLVAYSWGQSGSGGQVYDLNKWNMVTMVRTSSDCKFYLNGSLYYTGSAGSIPSGDYFLGSWRDYSSQNYKGMFSDARIYATALSENDIRELYYLGTSIDNNGNLMCYMANEGFDNLSRELGPHISPNQSNVVFNNDGSYTISGHTWPTSDYIPISPNSSKKYYYDIEFSNVEGNLLYVGFEKYDANKQSGSNSECQYQVATTAAANHKRVKGIIDLSTANGNTAAFTKLRILNNWNNVNNNTYKGTIHHISLKESVKFNGVDITREGVFDCDNFIESSSASIDNVGNVICNRLIEI